MFKLFYYAKRNTVPTVGAKKVGGQITCFQVCFLPMSIQCMRHKTGGFPLKASIVLDNEGNDIRHL